MYQCSNNRKTCSNYHAFQFKEEYLSSFKHNVTLKSFPLKAQTSDPSRLTYSCPITINITLTLCCVCSCQGQTSVIFCGGHNHFVSVDSCKGNKAVYAVLWYLLCRSYKALLEF
ncbi:hypothetical protein QVD17_27070 [Tagetes erecta]|uniref:Uncharacterized protein n=1 Tax=Tagetes erecta TaxID=13708 RepID=A0AAD8NQP9_TARER|nr:hypothetical protein QVD17_27070 [Tagetes erecta]